MPTAAPPCSGHARLRRRAAAVPHACALALALLVAVADTASWLGASRGLAQQDGSPLPRHASSELEHAARYVMALPGRPNSVALAAQGTQEGHWRFVNRAGEMFTVGTPDEMTRVVTVLYPEANAGARVFLYMTEDTILRHRTTLKALPPAAELHMVVRGQGYRLRGGDVDAERFLAEVRSNVALEPGDARLFQDVL